MEQTKAPTARTKSTAVSFARFLNVPVENVRRQFARNAVQLEAMAQEADAAPDGIHNGYTAAQLRELAAVASRNSVRS